MNLAPEVEKKRASDIETNRAQGVVAYKSGEKQDTSRVFEVVEGAKYLPGEKGQPQKRLGPGHRFHPTERQVANGSLRGKARELTATEVRGMNRGATVRGSDIGVRAVNGLSDNLAKLALDGGLEESDFAGIKGLGDGGTFTRKQVEELIDRKRKANG